MGLIKRINSKARVDNTTGFGTISSRYGGRLVNRDGTLNVRKSGINFLEKTSWYHTLIHLPAWKFYLLIFATFILINLFFGTIYYVIGTQNLGGLSATTPAGKYIEAFFFSAQTFTTVGYGRINPTGFLTSSIAAFEAFFGLLNFALATGLLYARFSRPLAFVKFSDNALISPFQNGIALMFRMAPFKNNALTDAEVKITLFMVVEENEIKMNKFFPLELEYSKVNALSITWTVVHPIDDKSPLFNFNEEDLRNSKAEIMVYFKAFDETFSNTVVARTSYTFDELVYGAKFVPMYHKSSGGKTTVIEMDKLSAFETADISYAFSSKSEFAARQ